ncbi:accessory Sec system glycosyltransferase Asp1 [Lactiplantibacillus modestisalitolerans]|uniref:Accessory Sec system glycosyltransferase Asp1 n=1 Tax=Lactiplantibacillus modestisalitolerans TaxID=1457219 RepID=A0ABV5WU85_9LACO|nr:accessory Sec system glycosyltransferase Asp1 [Lactiplantibacillus modestisalitolerans]
MIYFINEYLLQKNSSVEHAAINRVQLFAHQHVPAKIVTKIYDRLLMQTINQFDLQPAQVVNMFDYFQGTQAVPAKVMRTESLHLPAEYQVMIGANYSQVFNGDDLVTNVGFIPGTIGRVFYQEFFDNQGNLLSTDLWDWRGFKSATQYFGQNGKLIMTRYYNLAGQVVLEEYFVPDTKGAPLTSRIILKNYAGVAERFFQNTDDLFNFFIAELSRQDSEQTIFISDRPGTGVQPLLQLNDDAKKYVVVPIYHAKAINDPLHAPLDGFLQPALDNLDHFDGFITPTPSQAQHLQRRYARAHVTAIPTVTARTAKQQPLVPMAQRPKQLLYVGRFAPDRQLDQLIRVVALVRKSVPDVTCDLYGYGDPAYVETLEKLIAELDLTQQVRLKDYQRPFATIYDQYQLLLNTALANGGPLAMQEAQAHGLPVISYRFNYGPADYVLDGQDGYVIDSGDQLTMSKRIVALLQAPQQLVDFSQAAYQKMHTRQTPTKVWRRWQQLLAL